LIDGLQNDEYDMLASGLRVTSIRALVVNFGSPTTTEGIYLVAGQKKREEEKHRPR
jgi:ABC-type amino acid transport substrate-binding protein